jgi:hypothetical protein
MDPQIGSIVREGESMHRPMAWKPFAQWTLCGLVCAGAASAQVTLEFPDYTQQTTVTVNVGGSGSDQAEVTLPSGVGFSVTNIASSTASSAVSIAATGISLASSTAQLKISLQANAAAFTPPAVGAATWTAAAVSWNAASWTNATGAAGTLSEGSFLEVGTCNANVTSCSTTGLVFTRAPNTAVKRSGNHTLTVIWKIESIGS